MNSIDFQNNGVFCRNKWIMPMERKVHEKGNKKETFYFFV